MPKNQGGKEDYLSLSQKGKADQISKSKEKRKMAPLLPRIPLLSVQQAGLDNDSIYRSRHPPLSLPHHPPLYLSPLRGNSTRSAQGFTIIAFAGRPDDAEPPSLLVFTHWAGVLTNCFRPPHRLKSLLTKVQPGDAELDFVQTQG